MEKDMTGTEKGLPALTRIISQIRLLRGMLPDLEEYARMAGGEDAALRRYGQCRQLEDLLRWLQEDAEDDRRACEDMAHEEAAVCNPPA